MQITIYKYRKKLRKLKFLQSKNNKRSSAFSTTFLPRPSGENSASGEDCALPLSLADLHLPFSCPKMGIYPCRPFLHSFLRGEDTHIFRTLGTILFANSQKSGSFEPDFHSLPFRKGMSIPIGSVCCCPAQGHEPQA